MTDAGRIMIIPKGKYNASTTYERLDAVTYNGQGFIALKTVSMVTPTDDGTNWKLYVDNADINVSDLAPTFTVASARENINSGEKMSTLFSKVKKYFTDIKGHAYKDLVTNATTTTAGSPLDATVAKTLNDSIGTIKNQIGSNTVKTSVPENAKFTDTVYDDTDIKAEVAEASTVATTTATNIKDTLESPMLVTNTTRNLLIPNLQTVTKNGITCTNNGDGTYTLNGTASGNAYFVISGVIYDKNIINKYEGLKLVGAPSGSSYESFFLFAQFNGGQSTQKVYNDYGNGIKLNNIKGYETLEIIICVISEKTVSNLTFKPMITTDLNATYDDFVPYSGYDIKTCGKNIVGNPSDSNNPTVKDGIITFPAKNAIDHDTYLRLYSDVDISAFDTFRVVVESINEIINDGHKTYVIIKTASKKEFSTISATSFESSANKYVSNVFKCSDFGNKIAEITVVIRKGYAYHGGSYKISVFNGEDKEFSNWEPYVESSVHIDSSTEFPLLGLKSFNGETNIISPGNVEVTYAKNESGKAILGMCKPTVKNLVTTVEGNPLDATMGAQLKKELDELKTKLDELKTKVDVMSSASVTE